MNWIKCSERMPPRGRAVLVVYAGSVQNVTYFLARKRGEKGVWIEYESNGDSMPFEFVTHWMPLPQPPEE